ncbi:DNA helicase SRS2 NDAI_0G05500 [Naumovozyma dairenensis CBS 421]|uniref:DNA 3'-5' helicase n=1 Tax=Naumovozyma dairenensis (strain ATCC 10597 / BCRC 20456 / CBS 421 / NBRC 0211 / NRRL Y-12639) TaxID=1071378 RepID=J7SB42_NAUDC|nr:hypothetical protein NDAI_0G05500 [Naumovozyma dairenensis CBS 421]CCK73533.1 hypothetical protein NDAI_0G05500 [Naumovozyma dairenensis CBS 421]
MADNELIDTVQASHNNNTKDKINKNDSVTLKKILSGLNKQQKLAVTFDYHNALQVIAGPGTGKTKVLTSRVAYLLLKERINPEDIIITTFTNKASMEMIDRLSIMLRDTNISTSNLLIGTFHSVCIKILHRFGSKIDLSPTWRIADQNEIDNILSNIVDRMPDQIRDYANSMTRKVNLCMPKRGRGESDEWTVSPKLVKKQISKLKSSAILPEEYINDSMHDTALAYFYENFQSELAKINALDFDDILMYTFRLLTKERCLPNIQHVLVDEFQDTNEIQMDLVFLFAKGNHHLSRGISVVGDPDQSIYAFRNALAYNFQTMVQKSPIECSRIVLVENYRSSQKILDTSEMLISQQTRGRQNRLPLRAQFDYDFPPVYINFPASFLEASSIIKELLYLKALPDLFSFNDFAILVRKRIQIKPLERALIEHRVPYKILRGHAFWDSKEIIAMLNLLKCIFSPNEKNAIIASLLYPSRGLGQTSADKIKFIFEQETNSNFNSTSSMQILRDIVANKIQIDIPTKARNVIIDFLQMINTCTSLFNVEPINVALSDIFEKLYELSGLRYEYLCLDGKKKKSIDMSKLEENFDNVRHKNVTILKTYFLGPTNGPSTSSTDTNTMTNIGSISSASVLEHIRNFFNSLTLYTSDLPEISSSDEQQENMNWQKVEERKKTQEGVTISTIHGAKGLEWPVVFIPGCNEGTIPSIFNDEAKDGSSDDEGDDDDDRNEIDTDSKTSKKRRNLSMEELIDEERRMFFVAQTRAKYLLYLSSFITERQFENEPSRFLTSDLVKTMVDEQKVLEKVENVMRLYHAMKREPLVASNKKFSLKTLIKDYSNFIENRRERMIWGGEVVHDISNLNLIENVSVQPQPSLVFTTAATQLRVQQQGTKTNQHPPPPSISHHPFNQRNNSQKTGPSKNYAPNGSLESDLLVSPTKVLAPLQTMSPSNSPSNVTKSFAPSYVPKRNKSRSTSPIRKPFPSPERKKILSPTKSLKEEDKELALKSTSKKSSSRNSEKSKRTLSSSKYWANGNKIKQENDDDDDRMIFKKAPVNNPFQNTKVKFESNGRISKSNDSNGIIRLKREDDDKTADYDSSNNSNTTAAELLHNPDDMIIDNRPILTNAKTLADAIRKPRNRAENIKKEKKSEEQVDSENKGKKMIGLKKGVTASQMDIFSQLSRAKKKTKGNTGEIIIID